MRILVKKRDGQIIDFNEIKIHEAISKAIIEVNKGKKETKKQERLRELTVQKVVKSCNSIQKRFNVVLIEQIQHLVVEQLTKKNKIIGKAYNDYRLEKDRFRNNLVKLVSKKKDIYISGDDENANKPSNLINVKRDLSAGEDQRFIFEIGYPKHLYRAHVNKTIHEHDSDFKGIWNYANPEESDEIRTTNCCVINLEDMLENGTTINNASMEKPKSVGVCSNISSQIVHAISQIQYGGISICDFNYTLAKYSELSFTKNLKRNCKVAELFFWKIEQSTGDNIIYSCENISPEEIKEYQRIYELSIEDTLKDIYDACQQFEYQSNSIN